MRDELFVPKKKDPATQGSARNAVQCVMTRKGLEPEAIAAPSFELSYELE